MEAKDVKYIVIHCSAGFSGKAGIEAFWKTLGWKSPGYHRLIEKDGTIHKLSEFGKSTNGVRGFNNQAIHICYVGGVERVLDGLVAKDTRTNEQKLMIETCILEAIIWLKDNGKDITKDLMILGHRDFSKDGNKNGVIESWERIKECPSFNAIKEYNHIYGATNSIQILPLNRKG